VKLRKIAGKLFMKRNLAGTGNRYVGNQELVLEKLPNRGKTSFHLFLRVTSKCDYLFYIFEKKIKFN